MKEIVFQVLLRHPTLERLVVPCGSVLVSPCPISNLLLCLAYVLSNPPSPITVPLRFSTPSATPTKSGDSFTPRSRLSAISWVLCFSFAVPSTAALAGAALANLKRYLCFVCLAFGTLLDGGVCFDRELVGESNSDGVGPFASSYIVVRVGAAPGGLSGAVSGFMRMKPKIVSDLKSGESMLSK